MARNSKIYKIFKHIVVWTAVTGKASAAVLPTVAMINPDNAWQNLRRDLESQQLVGPNLGQLQTMLKSAPKDADIENIIRLSYFSATPGEMAQLDRFWLKQIAQRKDAAMFETFRIVRASVSGARPSDRETYLKDWIVRVDHNAYHSGENNGYGNGDQDAPGGSEPNNGAENDQSPSGGTTTSGSTGTGGNGNGNGGGNGNGRP
jgi:hypothetical protein